VVTHCTFSHPFIVLCPNDSILLKVSEDPKEEKKKAFVNFKRAVWHSAFHVVLRSILEYSRTGCWLKCGDRIDHWLFPILLILSADYEEQCVFRFRDLIY
jgi:hypothetical protein